MAKIWSPSLLAVLLFILTKITSSCASTIQHGYATFGDLKYPADFKNFDYVNPEAPKGDNIKTGALGTFDSLNPFIIKGTPPVGMFRCFATLLEPAYDEPASNYGYVAEKIEIANDRTWVIFHLNPKACFNNGTPITADDVIFSFETLCAEGKPLFSSYYKAINKVEKITNHQVKFYFKDNKSQELIAILGQIPLLSHTFYKQHSFSEANLQTFPCSGPYFIEKVDAGRTIVFKRVMNWWGENIPTQKGKNNFNIIQTDFYRDANAMFEAFKKGEIQVQIEMSMKRWATEYTFPAFTQGKVKKYPLYDHKLSYGSYGLYINTRRPLLNNKLVRQALTELFDFEWANNNLFYKLSKRNQNYFPNSPFAAQRIPQGEELKFLEQFKNRLPAEIFTQPFRLPVYKSAADKQATRSKALSLLKQAGWELKSQKLVNSKTGQPFVIEFLLYNPSTQRVALHFQNCLKEVGIELKVTSVDLSAYQERCDQLDFDIILQVIPQSPTPGNEQRNMWSSSAANQPGTFNIAGVNDPVIDEVIEKLIESPDYETLITRTKALDRLLLWGYYMIPAWQPECIFWVMWDRFKFPNPMCPPYNPVSFTTWWADLDKKNTLALKKESQAAKSEPSLWQKVKSWFS